MIKHTFIICAYQESPFLEQCLHSLLAQQTVKNGQSKVAIFTATPNFYIEKMSEQYQIELFIGKSSGIGANWNEALSFVETPYATIAHQDDIYLADYGLKVLNEFEANSDLNIVFSDYSENDGDNQLRARNLNLKIKSFGLNLMSLFNSRWYQRRIYAFGNFICCPAVSYNLIRLRDFKFDESLKMTLDWDAWERIMRLPGQIKFIPEKLMYHRIHQDSETTVNTLDQNREIEEYQMFQRYWPNFFAKLLMKFYVGNQKGNQ
ncbi:MAG: glycosyltransferase family 2 protein [Streptococcaceae bacterium]|jgi:glycosyltransferase involved in cell wall biosynthesis|nr:glycosyltransferase family 2 protein [Streptococcaceae bacterium]MCH4176010.1 glycosyltransferase family 2 protein [Streptococcaceae bacterium]